jgi:NAD(P)-dependent dehydrogenase (short-subunit alcohol dehydrogenase family)
MEVAGSTAIVFGGASGLGEATARALAEAGAEVVVADRSVDRAKEVAKDIGGGAVETDVQDPASVASAVERARASGVLRICVACAGVADPGKLLGKSGPTPVEKFRRPIEVNLVGTINCLGQSAWAMSSNEPDHEGERGVCVTTASVAAFEGQVGQVGYSASKGGVVGITLPIARELAEKGIRVATIAPGLFETPMMAGLPEKVQAALGASVPFPSRLGRPSEYADLVLHIVRNPMLNGETIRLDGAVRLPPR